MASIEEDDESYQPESSDYKLNEFDDSLITKANLKIQIQHERLQQMDKELGLIKLSWPTNGSYDPGSSIQLPSTYQSNNEKEKLLLWYAENFRKQYKIIHPQRKPIVLAVENECNIQKFVSTSIRPSTLPYPEFQTWHGSAKFVSDYVTYEPMRRPLSLVSFHILNLIIF
ncbi:dynein regulatory complex subunit 7-like [Aphidius gifuensis]|uniref:dynein regulatory complex subunit 7-like n=1 Tax=Aphidius gifuensis TaxID=684658 RepID=UPI001CDC0B53|nr:dynein regulatory complex subunit 7-like [Aphidius gifuensis]